nr:nucleoid-associated protein [Acetobacter thailandicus]
MILHVVGDEEFDPEPMRVVEHADFFVERIRETDVASVFEFHADSQTKAQLERMARGEDGFEVGGQALAREFSRFHLGSSRDGAFFIFELRTTNPDVRIYSLIKYDYQKVIEQQERADGANLLRLIVQAFVADKRAIQKAALVRVVGGVAETAIAAIDRVKQGAEIGDYFANYLHIVRTRDDEQLTRKAIEAVSNALKELKDILPDRDVPRAFRGAKEALKNRQRITPAALEEAVLAAAGNPEDERIIVKIQKCVQRKVKSAKLEGLEFSPNRNLLRSPAIRRVRTTEGVLLFYPDRVGDANVERLRTADGGEVITITTRHVEEDGIVRREPRSAN